MANNPYVNKVVFGSATLVDLTGTTATADKIMQGYGAFGADGAWMDGTATGGDQHGTIWQDGQGYVHLDDESGIALQSKTATPTETQQVIEADQGYYALDTVTVGAISSSYVGSGITRRSSSDLTANGATVTAPAGYYSASASKTVATGTAGTPTATKGTVSNHAVTVTPSVTNTTGYISGGTKTGTGVSVSASELVSGTYSVNSSGTKDVTNYASISVPAGTEGTPTATKGSVSNHSVSVTPSVTNTAGYIGGSTKTGTAVTVSASELVSGTKTITENGTGIDVTNYASVDVDVASSAGTVIHLHGTGSSTYAYVQLNGTKYYQEADIPFTAGDDLYICATPPDYGAEIKVDYVRVASTSTTKAEYTYRLKNFSIDVELSTSRFSSTITVLTPLAEADKITVTGSFTTNSGGGTQTIPHGFNDGGERYLASLRIWLGDMNNVPSEIPTGTGLIVSETFFKTYPEVAPAYTGTGDEDKLYGCAKVINSSGSTYNTTGGLYKNANASLYNVNISSSSLYIYSVPSGNTNTGGFIAGVTYSYEITFVANTGE